MPRVQKTSIIFSFALICICTYSVWPTSVFCQTERPFSSLQPGQYRDTLRALIVFTKFKDDKYPGDPMVYHRDWPLFSNPNQLPITAQALLSPNPHPPYPDSSLTAYFHNQSQGKFVLYGHAYDSVLVTSKPEAGYHKPDGGYGDLTQELLTRIDSYGFDFSKYDHNRDGYIDYVFVVLRGDTKRDSKLFAWTGASCLDGRCAGTPFIDSGPKPNPVFDEKVLDWNKSGSYIMHRTPGNVSSFHYYIRLMAHEIGHDLWASHFIHVPDNRNNDVPSKHNRGRFRDCVGYVLMAGAGGAWDCGGSETISAYERDLLGWIDCTTLSETSYDVTIQDLYTTSSCFKIELGKPQTRMYLSNLQHLSYFDKQRFAGKNRQFQIGLRTSGLLVHLVQGRGVDVIPADNTLFLSTKHAVYDGDLFGPDSRVQLTPWTRPNSNGFTHYPADYQADWIAIDHIRKSPESSANLIFDFHADYRTNPIIREDSWIGDETRGYVFKGPLDVINLSMLHIETDISASRKILVDTGSTLIIGPNATLHLQPESILELRHGSTLRIDGTLKVNGLFSRSPGATVIIGENGQIRSKLSQN